MSDPEPEQQRREQAEAALRAREEQLHALVSSAMDAIIAVDERQRIILFNPAASQMFGYDGADVLGQPLDRLIPARFREAHREHVREFGEHGVTARRIGGARRTHRPPGRRHGVPH